ncbi:hypothetical protein PInf_011671 [Phytophthora infestans]|nr:hypothetical protein PInf_011671 [Phytophthora infestans]
MAQYTQKFERWLDSRKMSLSSLRDNPAKERSLWHTFAYARAGASDLTEPAQSNAPRGSVPTAVSLPQRDRSLSPDRRDRSRSPPASLAPPENPHLLINKTRSQLLERRLLELAAFQKEIEQNGANATDGNTLVAIPVPLLPGESMGLYDHRFWTWAKSYSESKEDEFGANNYRTFDKNGNYVFARQIRPLLNIHNVDSRDYASSAIAVTLSDGPINKTRKGISAIPSCNFCSKDNNKTSIDVSHSRNGRKE